MKKSVVSLILVLLVSSLFGAGNLFEKLERFAKPKRRLSSSQYTSATYIRLISFGSYVAVQNGYALSIVYAMTPENSPDTTYSMPIRIRAIEENPNNSVSYYIFTGTGFVPDSIIPVENGSSFFLIKDSESENVIFEAYSPTGDLRPSYPISIYFEPAGTRATSLQIRGAKKMHAGADDGFSLEYVVAVDDSGRIDPTYMVVTPMFPIAFGVVSVGVVEESVPNGSVEIRGFFSDEVGPVVDVPLVSGIGFFTVNDNEVENVNIQAVSTASPPLRDSPIWQLEFVPRSVGTDLMLFSFTGFSTNVGFEKNLVVMSFTEDGPDLSNSTTEVLLSVLDITGYRPSFSLEPRTWGSLTSGVRGFVISDDEPDSFGLITKLEARGTPELNAQGMNPVIRVFPPGRAVRVRLLQQYIAAAGDTAKVFVFALDEFGNIDTTYDGYIQFEVADPETPSSFTFDYNAGMRMLDRVNSGILRMIDGKAVAYVYDSEPEELYITVSDAERVIFYEGGYIGGEESGPVNFVPPSAGAPSSYNISLGEAPAFFTDELYSATVIAVGGDGNVSTGYNGTAILRVSARSLFVDTDTVRFVRGIGVFRFLSSEPETARLTVSGELGELSVELVFVDLSSGGVILSNIADRNILVNSSVDAIVALISRSGINVGYSGEIRISVEETNPNGSARVPSSVALRNGIGGISFFDSEPERINLIFEGGDGVVGSSVSFVVRLDFVPSVPREASVGARPDTIYFRTIDGTGNLYPYTSERPACELMLLEEFPNGSASLGSSLILLRDGVGFTTIENTESETVWVIANVTDEFLSYEFEWEIGKVYFSTTGVDDKKPSVLRFAEPYPNPFNSFVVFSFACEMRSELKLEIYNMLGERVRTVYSGAIQGSARILWDAKDEFGKGVSSGIYFYKVSFGDRVHYGRVVYLK